MAVGTIEKDGQEEKDDDTTPILPVTNALNYVNKLKRLIVYFYNADETLRHFNKKLSLLKNIKQ